MKKDQKKCPLCKKKDTRLLYPANIKPDFYDQPYQISGSEYGRHLDILKCPRCSLIFEETGLVRNRVPGFYSACQDPTYEVQRENRALAFKKVIARIKKLKSSGRWLDVGCATGTLLVEAYKEGYEVYGIEPSAWAAKIAQKEGLKVKTGRIETVNFPQGYFEVVTMIDVLEHLINPQLGLQKVAGLLKKGGLVCLVTPNIQSLTARFLKEKWWHIRPGHFFYFSPQTINILLKEAGFEIVLSKSYKWYFSSGYLWQRLLKLLSLPAVVCKSLNQITIGLNLRDSMEVYALKR